MGCQWGMLIVLAKLGNPEQVGQLALGLAVTGPILLLFSLQLRSIIATDARAEYAFGSYFGLRLFSALAALGVVGIVTLASGYRGASAAIILLCGLAKAVESISDIVFGLLQRHERMTPIAISQAVKGVLALALFAAGFAITRNVAWGVAGQILSWTTILFSYDFPQFARLHPGSPLAGWQRPTLARLIHLSLPLGIVMMLISLNASMPRYFVERYRGPAELGIYAAVAYLPIAGTTV